MSYPPASFGNIGQQFGAQAGQSNVEALIEQISPALQQFVLAPLSQYLAQRGVQVSASDLSAVLRLPAVKPVAQPFATSGPGSFGAGGVQPPPKKSSATITPEEGKCHYLLNRGDDKGKYCGKKATSGNRCSAKAHAADRESSKATTSVGLTIGGTPGGISFPGPQLGRSGFGAPASLGLGGLNQAPAGFSGFSPAPAPAPAQMSVNPFDDNHHIIPDHNIVFNKNTMAVAGKKVVESTKLTDLGKLTEAETKLTRSWGLTVPESIVESALSFTQAASESIATGGPIPVPSPNPGFVPPEGATPVSVPPTIANLGFQSQPLAMPTIPLGAPSGVPQIPLMGIPQIVSV